MDCAETPIVYIAVNRNNGKCYIGITTRGLARRVRAHMTTVRGGSTFKFHNAIRKHGLEAFEFSVLRECLTHEQAKAGERELIALLRPEYNLTRGGDGVFGLKMSPGAKLKMSLAKKGKPSARKDHSHSLETIAKIKATKASKPPVRPWLGKKRSSASVEKMRATKAERGLSAMAEKANKDRRRGVYCVEDGLGFSGVSDAAKHYGLGKGLLHRHCGSGKERPYKTKLTFVYVEDWFL